MEILLIMSNNESNEPAARTTLKAVHIDTEARKSCAFEASIAARATALIEPGAAVAHSAKRNG